MTKVSTLKAPEHGPTLTGRGINCTGSRGPSRSPQERNSYSSNPSQKDTCKRRNKKKSSMQCKKPPQLEDVTATGGQRKRGDQADKLLLRQPLGDEASPMRHMEEKEACDVNEHTVSPLTSSEDFLWGKRPLRVVRIKERCYRRE